mgnify:CR=1 FL=1
MSILGRPDWSRPIDTVKPLQREGRYYPQEERERAVALVRKMGLRPAARALGIRPTSLRRMQERINRSKPLGVGKESVLVRIGEKRLLRLTIILETMEG